MRMLFPQTISVVHLPTVILHHLSPPFPPSLPGIVVLAPFGFLCCWCIFPSLLLTHFSLWTMWFDHTDTVGAHIRNLIICISTDGRKYINSTEWCRFRYLSYGAIWAHSILHNIFQKTVCPQSPQQETTDYLTWELKCCKIKKKKGGTTHQLHNLLFVGKPE